MIKGNKKMPSKMDDIKNSDNIPFDSRTITRCTHTSTFQSA